MYRIFWLSLCLSVCVVIWLCCGVFRWQEQLAKADARVVAEFAAFTETTKLRHKVPRPDFYVDGGLNRELFDDLSPVPDPNTQCLWLDAESWRGSIEIHPAGMVRVRVEGDTLIVERKK